MNKDITFGLPVEKERDLDKTLKILTFIRSKKAPVRTTIVDGRVFNMYVTGFHLRDKKVVLNPGQSSNKDDRVTIPVEYIVSIEWVPELTLDIDFKGRLTIKRGDLEDEGYKPSGRDFFRIIRQAYQDGKNIRVDLCDNRIIEGESMGMDEQQVSIRLPNGNTITIFYDWVDRILPIEKV